MTIMAETSAKLDEVQTCANVALENFFIKVAQFEGEYLGQEDGVRRPGMTQYIVKSIHRELATLKVLIDAIDFACDLMGRLRKKDEA